MVADNKLTITAYTKQDYSKGSQAGTYEVLINPESYRKDIEVEYDNEQALGSTAPELRYSKIPTEKVSFKLIFDGTGLITTAPKSMMEGDKVKPVPKQIEDFQRITATYSGDIHEPYFLELSWGDFSFRGVLVSLGLTYKLFKPDGTALRAEADVSFSSSVPKKDRKKQDRPKSPDVTHIVQVKADDRITALCASIYDDPNYFIQVARKNNLNHFRRLKPGTELLFPPVKN